MKGRLRAGERLGSAASSLETDCTLPPKAFPRLARSLLNAEGKGQQRQP